MSDKTENADIENMSFEAAMQALEEVVRQLESGQASLEDSITLYSRGEALKAHCAARLEAAELKVRQITEKSDGSVVAADANLG